MGSMCCLQAVQGCNDSKIKKSSILPDSPKYTPTMTPEPNSSFLNPRHTFGTRRTNDLLTLDPKQVLEEEVEHSDAEKNNEDSHKNEKYKFAYEQVQTLKRIDCITDRYDMGITIGKGSYG